MVKKAYIKLPPDQLSNRRIGRCQGECFSWSCNNWSSLRPVMVEDHIFWLCGRCEQRIRLGAKIFIQKYGQKSWKKGVQL